MKGISMRNAGAAFLGIAAVLLIALVVWMHFSAPCGMYKFSKVTDVPARCLSTYNK